MRDGYKIVAFAMPLGCPELAVEGQAVKLKLVAGSGLVHLLGLTRLEAAAAHDELAGALQAFDIGEDFDTDGAPI